MRALIAGLFIVLVATGMSCTRNVRTDPVPAACNAICFSPCTVDGDTGVRWEADPNDPAALDALGQTVVPALAARLRTCDTRREACAQCLRRLDDANVITL